MTRTSESNTHLSARFACSSCWKQRTPAFSSGTASCETRRVQLIDTYARSKFEDTRRKGQKFGARGTTMKAHKKAG